jgi:hypothetical protein
MASRRGSPKRQNRDGIAVEVKNRKRDRGAVLGRSFWSAFQKTGFRLKKEEENIGFTKGCTESRLLEMLAPSCL